MAARIKLWTWYEITLPRSQQGKENLAVFWTNFHFKPSRKVKYAEELKDTLGSEALFYSINWVWQNFPLALFLSLSVHALIDGFPVAHSDHVLWGVVIHKIPIALILSLFLIQSSLSKGKQLLFLFLFGLMTPLGTLVALYIPQLTPHKPFINALAVGVFLHVATTILFESSKDHQFNRIKLMVILAGALAGYMI